MKKIEKIVPELYTPLRSNIITMPTIIRNASGIKLFGRRIKSIIYTTDVAILSNTDADAVLAVYPFTPNTTIIDAISSVSKVPVFAGVGGGLTSGERCGRLAGFAEEKGVTGVVLNAPTTIDTIAIVKDFVDIPIIYTVISIYTPFEELENKIKSGVSIFNVSGGKDTHKIVKQLREWFPLFPIIATGGSKEETILRTIESGANAITYTPDYAQLKMFQTKMEKYRLEEEQRYQNNNNLKERNY